MAHTVTMNSLDETIHQSINPSIHQSIKQSINQSIIHCQTCKLLQERMAESKQVFSAMCIDARASHHHAKRCDQL